MNPREVGLDEDLLVQPLDCSIQYHENEGGD